MGKGTRLFCDQFNTKQEQTRVKFLTVRNVNMYNHKIRHRNGSLEENPDRTEHIVNLNIRHCP